MKICLVVEDIYPVLSGRSELGPPNGRAVHFKNLGAGLADIGCDVSFITMDYGQPEIQKLGGFTVYKMYRPDEGIPGLRLFLTKAPKLLKALKRADADIYMFMCPDPFVGIISWFCRKNGRKFIYYGGSDRDFKGNSWRMSLRDLYFFKNGVRNADLILCQNIYQLETLEKYHKRKGFIMYNAMASAERTYDPGGKIIWVANYRPLKRPEMFIELSKEISDSFVMIGGRASGCSEQEYRNMNDLAVNDNIRIRGLLGYDETDRAISRAKLLVSTSEFEGLSNTFLQAWRRGIPVVAFVDPDGMIGKNGLGRVVSNFEDMVEAVEELRKGVPEEYSRNIKDFFDRTFETGKVAARFDGIINGMIEDRRGKG